MPDYRPLSSLRFLHPGMALPAANPVPGQGQNQDETIANLIRAGQNPEQVLRKPRYYSYPPVAVGIRG